MITLNLRNLIIDEINLIEPFDDIEKKYINESIKWIKETESIFRVKYPNDPHKHLVTAYIIYDQNQKKFLLFKHVNAQMWLPGGGHVEINEHPKDAVMREMKEEINMNANFIVNHPVFLSVSQTVNENPPHIDVSLCYLIEGNANQKIDFDRKEFEGYNWYSVSEVANQNTDLGVKRFVEKFKAFADSKWLV